MAHRAMRRAVAFAPCPVGESTALGCAGNLFHLGWGPPPRRPKTGKAGGGGEDIGKNQSEAQAFLMKICDAPKRRRPEFTEAQYKRHFEIGRRYNIETSRLHNREAWELQLKIDLKGAAMAALPAEQQAFASEVLDFFPLDFRHPTTTPPVQGFDASRFMSDESEAK
uniref:Uncharacterized protein n=1 Tax=Rhizochromulina marina TaxID=1034831 RepID=A0A7S2RGK1_9STRA|mmetsp:Transcript_16034/g.47029  ORF Transcript_16034/g.47029 Transcript_16034/m.47029 type:complete len:167 (+) Transcript_16034:106-606(+)